MVNGTDACLIDKGGVTSWSTNGRSVNNEVIKDEIIYDYRY